MGNSVSSNNQENILKNQKSPNNSVLKQQSDNQNTQMTKNNNNNLSDIMVTPKKQFKNSEEQGQHDEDNGGEDEEEEVKINADLKYQNKLNQINLNTLNQNQMFQNKNNSNNNQIDGMNTNSNSMNIDQNANNSDLQSIQSTKQQKKQQQKFEFKKQPTIDENSLIASQSVDKINTLKQQEYKQANIMQFYNNNQYTYQQGKPKNNNNNNNTSNNQYFPQIDNNDNLLYTPSKQQKFLKQSPQIPPKVIPSNLFVDDEDEIKSQKSMKENNYFDVNDENSNKNIGNMQQDQIIQKKDNMILKIKQKQLYNQSFNSTQTIPCELCQLNINEEDYQQHIQNCYQKNGQNEEIPTQEQHFQKYDQQCTIECEVCKQQVLFEEYTKHQEKCDYMVVCHNCKKSVQRQQFNKHLEECIENPWVTKNNRNQQNMKMCDFCRILILFDSEQEFNQHLNEHQKKKKSCGNCGKSVRFKYNFQWQQHVDKKCIQDDIKKNPNSHQRILLLTLEESKQYVPNDFKKKNEQKIKRKKNGDQMEKLEESQDEQMFQGDKGKLQEYWDMLDRYIYEENHGLQNNIINKISSFTYNSKKKFMQKKSVIQMCVAQQYGSQNLTKQQMEANTKQMKQKLKEWDEKCCTICMDDFMPKNVVSFLPCQHAFHKPCLEEWLKRDGVCAVCRKNVTEMVK